MDLAPLISRIGQRVSGAVLEQQRFGRSNVPCVWIEAKKLVEVASFLREDKEASLTWLETIGAAQLGEAIVLSYFVRSPRGREEVVLRVALELTSKQKEEALQVASVRSVWPMAAAMEAEIGELFGIKFGDAEIANEFVHGEVSRFPLRKDATWPKH